MGDAGTVRVLALSPWLLTLVLTAAACDGQGREEPAVTAPDVISVTSTAFADGKPIPARFTCDGANTSPPLAWDGVPEEAEALALVVDDPDAPRGTFVHWVVLDIPTETRGVDESRVPGGATQAKNSAGRASYFGPCPPSGTHHYRFTVYALSSTTGLNGGVNVDKALQRINELAMARGRLVGTYARAR